MDRAIDANASPCSTMHLAIRGVSKTYPSGVRALRDIVAIEAEGDGSTLHLAPHPARKPSAKSLREWEQRLPDRQFVRIHRSTIVNLEYVERLEPWSHASQHVYLRGLPKPMTMSRRFGARLRDRFG